MTTATSSTRRAKIARRAALPAAGAAALAIALPMLSASAGPAAVGDVTNLVTTGSGAVAVAAGDLDGNGVPDLVSASAAGVSVSLSTGSRTYASAVSYAGPSELGSLTITSLTVADVTGDGIPDVIASAASSNLVLIWPGNGDGTLGTPSEVQLNPLPGCGLSSSNPCVAAYPAGVAVGDFNGDGIPDIATANTNTNNVSVVLGNGDGTFGTATQIALSSTAAPAAIATADVDADGHLDLVLVGGSSGVLSVLRGDGTGGFASPVTYSTGLSRARTLTLADLNGDGVPDAVVADGAFAGSVAVVLGDGTGGFGTPALFAAGATPRGVGVTDLNGDGHPDLAIADTGSNTVLVLTGDGTGGFGDPQNVGLAGGSRPAAIAVADLDGDGRTDIVTGNAHSSAGDVSILWNASNRAPVAVNDSYSHPGSDTTLSVAAPGVLGNDTDADGDSLTAALVSGPSHGTVTLNANGSFTYQASEGYVGSDSFTYRASDGVDTSNTATVTIATVAGCDGQVATITGSGIVNGTPGNDVIATGNGNDIVNAANGGNDVICTYGGNDIVNLSGGTNYVNAGSGNDIVNGGPGNDTIYGGPGNDILNGGGGTNTIVGGGGTDIINN